MAPIDYNIKRRVAALEAMNQQAGTPIASDFDALPGDDVVKGPIFCTGDNRFYYLLADGTTVKKTAALS